MLYLDMTDETLNAMRHMYVFSPQELASKADEVLDLCTEYCNAFYEPPDSLAAKNVWDKVQAREHRDTPSKTEYVRQVTKTQALLKNKLPLIDLFASYNCNLKCANCVSGSPFCSSGYYCYPTPRELENSLNKLVDLCGPNRLPLGFNVVGGEPLLNPSIVEFVTTSRKVLGDDAEIHLTTNGLLIPRLGKQLLTALARTRVTLQVSVYLKLKTKFIDLNDGQSTKDCVKCIGHECYTVPRVRLIDSCCTTPLFPDSGKLFYCGPLARLEITGRGNQLVEGVEGDVVTLDSLGNYEELLAFHQKSSCPHALKCGFNRENWTWWSQVP